MKRSCVWFLVIMMVVSFLIHSASAEGTKYVVTGDGVFVRDPSDHHILSDGNGGDMKKFTGDIVTVVDYDDYWYYIKLNDGSTAIMYRDYLQPAGIDQVLAKQQPKTYTKIEISDSVARFIGVAKKDTAVYKQVDGGEVYMGKVAEGDTLYVYQLGKFWYRIVYQDSKFGYVSSEAVELIWPNVPMELGGTPMAVNVPESYVYVLDENGKAVQKYTAESGFVVVAVLEYMNNGMARIAYNSDGDIGYISKQCLKETTLFKGWEN